MRRPILLGLAALALALTASSQAAADPAPSVEPPRISAMADDLQRLQTGIAAGDRLAYPTEIAELKTIAEAIAAAKPGTWADRREADALVVYMLSGGALAPVVPLVKQDAVAASERALVRGAVAYVSNHEADALELLGPTDLGGLDIRIAGPVAFARSVLRARRDPTGAVAELDWARLIAPGGLVEEAALRREIGLLVEAHDAPRVALHTRQYATRFPASLYAPDFLRDLARMIARSGLADQPGDYRLLSDAAARLPPDGRRGFLLTLARASTLNGRFEAAASAAGEVLQIAPPGSAEEARARLYLGAGRIASDAYDAALADLAAVAPARLDTSDAALFAAARNVAVQVRAAPTAALVEAQRLPADVGKDAGPSTIGLAEDALRRTSSLLADRSGAP